MPTYTSLKFIDSVGKTTLSQQLQDNLVEFFSWGLIDKGGFFNVNIPAVGLYGGNKHQLRLVDDPNYTAGQVWEGYRNNWVWESGLSTVTQPIAISGVFVGGSFHPATGVGAHAHHIDYPNGRIIFDSAISTTNTVTAEYSYKWIKVTAANATPWFREVQYRADRLDSSHFSNTGSGDWSQLGQTRLQLPAIGIEIVPRRSFKPLELGGLSQWTYTDVLFHILTEDEFTRNKLVDIVSFQQEKTIYMFDVDKIAQSGRFPLDYRGMLSEKSVASGALNYPNLVTVSGYRDRELRFSSMSVQQMDAISPSLHLGTVRGQTEVILSQL
jgi:hypothetical protein|tara:strand:+ start:3020 stop:3997 length:978 start_codon:yes stop_codon:yes gene_type:complete